MKKILQFALIVFLHWVCLSNLFAQQNAQTFKVASGSPSIIYSPTQLAAAVWPLEMAHVPFLIVNAGDEVLTYDFLYYSGSNQVSPSTYTYCAASGGCSEYISNVSIGTINNSSSSCTGYQSFTSVHTNLNAGETIPISVTIGNAYSGDIVGVWVDFDQSSTFDNDEFTQLSGFPIASGGIVTPESALTGPTTMRVRVQYNGTLNPCGTTSYGEVEDYTVNILKNTFVNSIVPAQGSLLPGDSSMIYMDFGANGIYSQPGIYYDTIELVTNDPNHSLVRIPAKMHTYLSAFIQGKIVYDYPEQPLSGVKVSAFGASTLTNDTGYYQLMIPAQIDNTVTFSRPGFYVDTTIANVLYFDTLTLNDTLYCLPNPPGCAHAEVDTADTRCVVSWCTPLITNLYKYNDFASDTLSTWENAGNMYAVRFTPDNYPATLKGFQIMIGDDVNPYGSGIWSELININVYDDDGMNGMPGTLLDSITMGADNFPWIDNYNLEIPISEGDFYISITQLSNATDCVPLGTDTIAPYSGRSYSRNVTNGEDWIQRNDRNYLIHAFIEHPDDSSGVMHHSSVARLSGFDPDQPMPGAACLTLLNNNSNSFSYSEGGATWSNLPSGWYAYMIQFYYYGYSGVSETVYTNIVPHKLFADIGINVLSGCDTLPAEGVTVTLIGSDYPRDTLVAQTNSSGNVFFDNMIFGHYHISVSGFGFTTYSDSINIQSNLTTNVLLEVSTAKPENLAVNENTLIADWETPLFDAPGANSNQPLEYYAVYLDGALQGETPDLYWDFSENNLYYGQTYIATVSAHYCTGYSEPDTFNFVSHYLPAPLGLTLDTVSTPFYALANFHWQLPDTSGTFCKLIAYNIYKNDVLLTDVSAAKLNFTDTLYTTATVCYKISAVYDLAVFGFPAQNAESLLSGPVCSGIAFGNLLPFEEDWSNGFDENGWLHGQNWVIQESKSDASARFVTQPLLYDYSSTLQSYIINALVANSSMPYDIFLYFDLSLLNKEYSNQEILAIEVLSDSSWIRIKEYTNNTSFDIHSEKLNISELTKNSMFKVRFVAEGINSDHIQYWELDNILVKAELTGVAPQNLNVMAYGNDGNDLQLQWNPPSSGDDSPTSGQGNKASGNFFDEDGMNYINTETTAPQGYNIYRRSFRAPASSNDLWVLITTTTDTTYIDENLTNFGDNCYEYYVTSVFEQGESSPSNIVESCIFVSTRPVPESGIVVYPNPVDDFVNINLKQPFEILRIFNSLGTEVEQMNIYGTKEFTINLKAYLPGTYLLQFTSLSGKVEVVKMIVEQ